MFKFLPRALSAFALLLAPAAHAQETKDADPALWVVKDADTTIYLFGTVHVLKPGLSWFDEAVKTAFDKSDELVLEMVEPDAATMQGLVMKTAVNLTGPTLTEKLPADKREAYAKALTDIGIPAAALDRVDPWFAAVTLSLAGLPKLGYDPQTGAERTLSAAAKTANKQVVGLETAEQQLGYFDSLPEPLQIKFLVSTIDDYAKMGTVLDQMVANWSAGDPEALGRVMNEELSETPEIAKVLLADRNARWAEWIDKRLEKPGTVFVAVGAGHLAGAESVQAQLAKHKLAAKRVVY
ncbi:TraB/GumN family protein [Sphingomonas psychrotolerans]|uniref:TraB/GumN family protein n=1 Tax=Sphingomonas psychrotolerans TaxID=1327635 RepID=A0ABU3NAP4_9SPHN|nr:TraB/GumN family protein [Sphingomonas psychrotolerans]MDT8760490.1 TraB/GumN family protein [Sphingomonas psychrotolerans]